jgi:hypothetical protein
LFIIINAPASTNIENATISIITARTGNEFEYSFAAEIAAPVTEEPLLKEIAPSIPARTITAAAKISFLFGILITHIL